MKNVSEKLTASIVKVVTITGTKWGTSTLGSMLIMLILLGENIEAVLDACKGNAEKTTCLCVVIKKQERIVS
jgi:16S rRNA C967 or C1407 C5-methylase (RsmB/RsmF family)